VAKLAKNWIRKIELVQAGGKGKVAICTGCGGATRASGTA